MGYNKRFVGEQKKNNNRIIEKEKERKNLEIIIQKVFEQFTEA